MMTRDKLNRIVGAMQTERSSWDAHWRDITDYIDPWSGRYITGTTASGVYSGAVPAGGSAAVNRGDKKHGKILDGSATQAVRVMSAGMMSGLTSPARPWFRLTVPDPDLSESQLVRQWLDDVTQTMRDLFIRSNLYGVLPMLYQDIGMYGTSAVQFDDDPDRVFAYRHYPIGTYMLAQDASGRVNRFARRLRMTAAQIVERFGQSRQVEGYQLGVSRPVQQAAEKGEQKDTWYDVLHLITPNPDAGRYGDLDPRSRPFLEYWWEAGGTGDMLLEVTGYYEFPVMAPRWRTLGEDVWGNGPGFDALPDVKSLQVLQKQKARANQKAIDPPLLGDSRISGKQINVDPGGLTWLDGEIGSNNGVRPLYQGQFDIRGTLEDIADHRQRINDTFFVSLFLMLANDRRTQPPTAEEIRAREAERMLMLGPVLERLNDEHLDPLIDRAFAIMERRGLLPPPPPELEGVDLKVEYVSILAQAQKAVGLSGIDRLVGTVANVATISPEVIDKIDWDQVVDETANMIGTPSRLVRSDDDVQAMRQQRAAAQAQAQATALAAEQAQTAKTLSETDTERQSALTDLLG